MAARAMLLDVPCTAYELDTGLRHPDRFPDLSDDITAVTVDGILSHWEVSFRGGPVRWTQRDRVQPLGLRNDFEQVEGDFAALSGFWAIELRDRHCALRYELEHRTSVAHLAGAVDPMIRRVLLRSMCAVVEGIAGPIEVIEGSELLHDWPCSAS